LNENGIIRGYDDKLVGVKYLFNVLGETRRGGRSKEVSKWKGKILRARDAFCWKYELLSAGNVI
jgi:hypothetical protein